MSGLEADALVLLTNVDGLLRRSPKVSGSESTDKDEGTLIPMVEEITEELKAVATGPAAGGRGGMATKLEAAQIAMQAGGITVIANGMTPNVLDHIFAGEQVGTAFLSASRMGGKRRWLTYAADVRGRVIVNEGAREAIIARKASLLSSGVVRVEQQFEPHDVVSIADSEGREFARGGSMCEAEGVALIEGTSISRKQEGAAYGAAQYMVLSEQENQVARRVSESKVAAVAKCERAGPRPRLLAPSHRARDAALEPCARDRRAQ